MKPTTVSLFCGGGGESAGKERAFQELGLGTVDMVAHAVNHWDLAVATHGANFPYIHVHQEDITEVTAETFGVKHIDLLWASPSCVHHSRARGGEPCSEQLRSHADEVVERWLKVANVDVLMVENVPEFQDWGPLHRTHSNGCEGEEEKCLKGCHYSQPIKSRKGEFFRRFVKNLEGLGYTVEWRVLRAADYGDPTIRRRFFLQAVKDGCPIVWPEPSHRDPARKPGFFDAHLPPWRTASECIDWSIPCPSIFNRKRPLAEATMRRIATGVVRYVLESKRPYVVGAGEPKAAANMITLRGTTPSQIGASPAGMDEPLRTVSAGGNHAALCTAFLAKHYGGVVGHGVDRPLGTVTTVDHHSLVTASIMGIDNQSGVGNWAADAPLSTITTKARHAVLAASLIQTGYGERTGQAPRCLNIESPLGTVAGGSKHALVASFLERYAKGGAPSMGVTVEIDGETYLVVDIGMRMLEPHELAKAMGFPDGFRWVDGGGDPLTKRDSIKMVGNACPVNTVAALIKAVVLQRPGIFGAPIRATA